MLTLILYAKMFGSAPSKCNSVNTDVIFILKLIVLQEICVDTLRYSNRPVIVLNVQIFHHQLGAVYHIYFNISVPQIQSCSISMYTRILFLRSLVRSSVCKI